MTITRAVQLAREFRKGIVAAVNALASIAALNLLPSPYDRWVSGVLAVAAAFGVVAIPNEPKTGTITVDVGSAAASAALSLERAAQHLTPAPVPLTDRLLPHSLNPTEAPAGGGAPTLRAFPTVANPGRARLTVDPTDDAPGGQS